MGNLLLIGLGFLLLCVLYAVLVPASERGRVIEPYLDHIIATYGTYGLRQLVLSNWSLDALKYADVNVLSALNINGLLPLDERTKRAIRIRVETAND